MKRFTLLVVTALLGLVVSAPAQRNNDGRFGRQTRGTVVVNQQSRVHSSNRHVGRVPQSARTNRSDRSRHGSRIVRGLRQVGRNVVRNVGRNVGRGPVVRSNRNCGHWETRCERVLVPGYWTVEHVPATYGWVYDSCGRRHWGVIQAAHDHQVWVPARYENQTRRVWVRH